MSAMTEAKVLPSSKQLTEETGIGITKPHDNDVLFGRGGNINVHPGNELFRGIVREYKKYYIEARDVKEKRLIADEVLAAIAKLNPPGRFLAKDSSTGLWHAVGYEKARNKASQALRENISLLKPNIHIENAALRAELKRHKEQESRRIIEQCYAPHHGHQPSYREYHDENMMPSINRSMHRENNINSSDLHTCNELSHDRLPYYNTVSDYQFKHERMPTEVIGNNHNHHPNHFIEDKEHSNARTKDLQELSCSLRPPKINRKYGSAAWNNTLETSKDSWYSTPTSTNPSLNLNCIMDHSNGEDKKASIPVVIDDKVRRSKMKQDVFRENEMGNLTSSSFGCHTKEEMFMRERLASRGELTFQSMDIDDSGTIGGQSLVNVFDGDSMRNREISDISMQSDL